MTAFGWTQLWRVAVLLKLCVKRLRWGKSPTYDSFITQFCHKSLNLCHNCKIWGSHSSAVEEQVLWDGMSCCRGNAMQCLHLQCQTFQENRTTWLWSWRHYNCSYMPNSTATHPRRLASYLRLLYGSSPQAHNPSTFKLLTLILFVCNVILAITSWCESFRCVMCCICLCSSSSRISFAWPSSSCSFLSSRWLSLTCACSCNQ